MKGLFRWKDCSKKFLHERKVSYPLFSIEAVLKPGIVLYHSPALRSVIVFEVFQRKVDLLSWQKIRRCKFDFDGCPPFASKCRCCSWRQSSFRHSELVGTSVKVTIDWAVQINMVIWHSCLRFSNLHLLTDWTACCALSDCRSLKRFNVSTEVFQNMVHLIRKVLPLLVSKVLLQSVYQVRYDNPIFYVKNSGQTTIRLPVTDFSRETVES